MAARRRLSVIAVVLALGSCGVLMPAAARRGGIPELSVPTFPVTATAAAMSQREECGTITIRDGSGWDEAGARAAGDCFWWGYQRCVMGGAVHLSVRSLVVMQYTDVSSSDTGMQGAVYDATHATVTDFRTQPGVEPCAVRVSGVVSNSGRTATGRDIALPGNYVLSPIVCDRAVRAADGSLHAEGCPEPRSIIAIP